MGGVHAGGAHAGPRHLEEAGRLDGAVLDEAPLVVVLVLALEVTELAGAREQLGARVDGRQAGADVRQGSGLTVSNEARGGAVGASLDGGAALLTVLHPPASS